MNTKDRPKFIQKTIKFSQKSEQSQEDLAQGIFEGYGSAYENIDDGGDIVHQGAFAEQLSTTGLDRIKILALHDDNELPIGKPLELYEDEKGLYLKAKISKTSRGSDVIILLQDQVMDELSIGFEIIEDYEDENGIRHIIKANLFEISVVIWAMNPKAKITDVKKKQVSFSNAQKCRSIKKFQRIKRKSKITKLRRGAK